MLPMRSTLFAQGMTTCGNSQQWGTVALATPLAFSPLVEALTGLLSSFTLTRGREQQVNDPRREAPGHVANYRLVVGQPICHSLQARRRLAEAFVSSRHPEVLPQLLALSLSIKSPFGVSGSVLSRQAEPTSARGAFWTCLSRTVTSHVSGPLAGGRNERNRSWPSLSSINGSGL